MASNPKRPRIHGAAPPAASGTSGALAEGVEAYRKWRNAREKKQENTEAQGEAQELEVLGDEEDMESMVVHVQQAQVGQVESRVPRPWMGRGSRRPWTGRHQAQQGRSAPVAPLHQSKPAGQDPPGMVDAAVPHSHCRRCTGAGRYAGNDGEGGFAAVLC